MKYTFLYNETEYSVTLETRGSDFTVHIGDSEFDVTDVHNEHGVLTFAVKDTRFAAYHGRNGDIIYINVGGENYTLEQVKSAGYKRVDDTSARGDFVSSPMPGLVVKIPVALGEQVEKGTVLAIVEAMKMQNELRAPRQGIVKRINFKEGEQIDALRPIVELE